MRPAQKRKRAAEVSWKNFPAPTTEELEDLGEYLCTRPDLENSTIVEIELALKKAGWISAHEDHFYTAMHAVLRRQTIRGRRAKAVAQTKLDLPHETEWQIGLRD